MILETMSKETGVSVHFLSTIVNTASHRYKTYVIPKTDGGLRLIQHPSRSLKYIQRWIVRNIVEKLPVHPKAMAYQKEGSIKRNAEMHAGSNFLLKVDFRSFFESIQAKDVRKLIQINYEFLKDCMAVSDIDLICKAVCRNDRLTIGAPSSPSLSNAIMYHIDEYWDTKCSEGNVIYSRYADDICFSTVEPNRLAPLLVDFCAYLTALDCPRLELNNEKTVFSSRKRHRKITGVTLTSVGSLSLGRQKKRQTKALIHRAILRQLSQDKVTYLRGYLSFISDVEPSFIRSLEEKYGRDRIKEVLGC